MDFELKLKKVNSEINEILTGTCDTIYFDSSINTFRVEYNCGYAIDMTLDRFIDIL